MKPNLFIVGQPKAGTTALHEYLSFHPRIFMCPVKEPHYFCTDFHRASDQMHPRFYFPYRTVRRYEGLFAKTNSDALFVGESSTNYFYSSAAPLKIRHYNCDAKIIICLRNPIDFVRSWFMQCRVSEGEAVTDLNVALRLEAARKRGKEIPENATVPDYLFYRTRLNYDLYLQRYLDNFGADNVFVLLYEDFVFDNVGELRKILRFLGLEDIEDPPRTIRNLTKASRNVGLTDFLLHSKVRHIVKRLLPLALRRRIGFARHVERFLFKPAAKPFLEEELLRELKEYSAGKLSVASRIVGRDSVGYWFGG